LRAAFVTFTPATTTTATTTATTLVALGASLNHRLRAVDRQQLLLRGLVRFRSGFWLWLSLRTRLPLLARFTGFARLPYFALGARRAGFTRFAFWPGFIAITRLAILTWFTVCARFARLTGRLRFAFGTTFVTLLASLFIFLDPGLAAASLLRIAAFCLGVVALAVATLITAFTVAVAAAFAPATVAVATALVGRYRLFHFLDLFALEESDDTGKQGRLGCCFDRLFCADRCGL
jgi:hypothetical protein